MSFIEKKVVTKGFGHFHAYDMYFLILGQGFLEAIWQALAF